MQFLIDRGIDMTIKDYRWNSTAANWARYGNNDEKMAQWLEDADRRRQSTRLPSSHRQINLCYGGQGRANEDASERSEASHAPAFAEASARPP